MIPVPRRWPGETVVLIGAGPSLTLEDVQACRGQARVIAINRSVELAPWADVLYACDAKMWKWLGGAPSFTGLKYTLDPDARIWPAVTILRNTGPLGLEADPSGLRTGKNSGYQAINLAVHLGAARILLLGYDMAPAPTGVTHWHGEHPSGPASPYPQMRAAFASMVEPLAAAAVTVINCSRRTALDTFPRMALVDALAAREVVA
jgi:hypothetical protein